MITFTHQCHTLVLRSPHDHSMVNDPLRPPMYKSNRTHTTSNGVDQCFDLINGNMTVRMRAIVGPDGHGMRRCFFTSSRVLLDVAFRYDKSCNDYGSWCKGTGIDVGTTIVSRRCIDEESHYPRLPGSVCSGREDVANFSDVIHVISAHSAMRSVQRKLEAAWFIGAGKLLGW
jgi:hypothetical protein